MAWLKTTKRCWQPKDLAVDFVGFAIFLASFVFASISCCKKSGYSDFEFLRPRLPSLASCSDLWYFSNFSVGRTAIQRFSFKEIG